MSDPTAWPRLTRYKLREVDGHQVLSDIVCIGPSWRSDVGQHIHQFHIADDGTVEYEVWHVRTGEEAVRVWPPLAPPAPAPSTS